MSDSSYQEQSFRSLVEHFDVELRKILDGGLVTDILNHNQRGKLRKYGVLIYRLKVWYVSKEAMEILQQD